MKKNIFISSLLFVALLNGQAQLKTYIHLDAGPAWDVNRVTDPGNLFTQSNIYGTVVGIAIWQEVIENLSIGTGLYYHSYSNGINVIDQRPHQASQAAYNALLIPARISYRLQMSDFPLSFSPILGYQYGKILSSSDSLSISSTIADSEGSVATYTQQATSYSANRLHLIEAGFKIDYRFVNNWQLSLGFSHFSGLQEVSYSSLNYTNDLPANIEALYSNDGGRIQFTASIAAPISNLWENKSLRLHRKIENSSTRGNSIKHLRYIYFGGDLGALWRSFSSSNPAIGAIPLENKGVFRYSNLHTGAFFGYMFNEYSGFEIGAYYQKSSSHFSLMYDQIDYVTKVSAPFFLEVPLMYKYFYDLYDEKVFLVPGIGVSLMTHFAGSSYNSGSGEFMLGNDTETFSYTANRIASFGYQVKTSLALEYKIPIKFSMNAFASVSYSQGLRKIDVLEINTSLAELPEMSQISYDGSGWKASIGVRMPIVLGKENRKCGAIPNKR